MPSPFAYPVDLTLLRRRAAFLSRIRAFFLARNVLEVETPLLAHAPVTDPHIDAIETVGVRGYLQTSPEYAMKRLLAMGMGDCFQLCKAFRVDPTSRIHHPEFTMLEFYRLGFDDIGLMADVDALLQEVFDFPPAIRLSYESAFQRYVGVSALNSSADELKRRFVDAFGPIPGDALFSIDDWRMLLFSHAIEPKLTGDAPVFIYDFPASQAALARLKPGGVAARFEVYIHGIEIGNGYHELTDPIQQAARFDADLARRKTLGKPPVPVDTCLLAALEHGLPDCAGIALGVDRLVLAALQAKDVHQVAVMNPDVSPC